MRVTMLLPYSRTGPQNLRGRGGTRDHAICVHSVVLKVLHNEGLFPSNPKGVGDGRSDLRVP